MKNVFLVLYFFLSSITLCAELNNPNLCRVFIPENDGKHYAFLNALLEDEIQSEFEKRKLEWGIQNACGELSKNTFYGAFSRVEKPLHIKAIDLFGNSTAWVIELPGMLTSLFKNSKAKTDFLNKLDKIKMLSNPIKRVKEVSELVIKYQGSYDHMYFYNREVFSRPILLDPSDVLEDAQNKGIGGVCRDFAILFKWALNKVKFPHPNSVPQDYGHDYLDRVFQVQSLGGTGYDLYRDSFTAGHAWIRVLVPIYEGKRGYRVRALDLDSTWYTDGFTPVMRRNLRPSDEKLREMVGHCQDVLECVKAL